MLRDEERRKETFKVNVIGDLKVRFFFILLFSMSAVKVAISAKLQPDPNYIGITENEENVMKQVWQNLLCSWGVLEGDTSTLREVASIQSDATSKSRNSGGSLVTSVDSKVFWEMLKTDVPDSLVYRFVKARKFDSAKATKMLLRCLQFRSERKLEELLNGGELQIFANKEVGVMKNLTIQKATLAGHDLEGRPFILVRPKFHHSSDQSEEDLEKFALLIIELAKLMMKTGCISIIFDLSGFGLTNMDYAPVKFLISVFEAQYPESLSKLLIHKAPWIFTPIWNIVKKWLDPVVSTKIVFTKSLEDLQKYISIQQIPAYLGGQNEYDLDNYSPPNGNEDKLLQDNKGRESLLTIRENLISDYYTLTEKWIKTTDRSKSRELWDERVAIGREIFNNYCELDPYIRSRSSYDINGLLKV